LQCTTLTFERLTASVLVCKHYMKCSDIGRLSEQSALLFIGQ